MSERPGRGRPEGRRYPHSKTVKLRDVDVRRLAALEERLDRDRSALIRLGIEVLARQEGVE